MFIRLGTSVINTDYVYMLEDVASGAILHYKVFGRDQKVVLTPAQRVNFLANLDKHYKNLNDGDLIEVPWNPVF